MGDVSHSVLMAYGIKQVRTSQFTATVLRCEPTVVFSLHSKAIFNKQRRNPVKRFSVCVSFSMDRACNASSVRFSCKHSSNQKQYSVNCGEKYSVDIYRLFALLKVKVQGF